MAALKTLLPFLQGLRWRYACGAFLLVITNACALLIPWLLKLVIDGLQHPEQASLSAGRVALLIGLVAAGYAVVRIFSRTMILNAARLLEFQIREALFARLMTLDLGYFSRERSGDILSRFANDLTNVRMLTGFGVMSLLNTAVIYLAGLWLMIRINPWLTVAAVAPLPLMVLAVRMMSSRIFSVSRQAQDELARLSSLAEESVGAIRLIKSYCRETYVAGQFDAVAGQCLARNLELARLRGLVMPIMALATGAGTLAVLYLGGRLVIGSQISLGQFVAFSGYLALLAWPTAVLGWILTLAQRGAASMERLNELLQSSPAVVERADAQPVVDLGQGLEARQLSFRYGDRPVLQDISFYIRPGERVGITGPVGCGKSTLLRLIPRLLPLSDGMLFINGQDVNGLELASLRRLMGYLPQETTLFSRSIAENVAYGGDGILELAVQRAGLDSDLQEFSAGLTTVVGERGVTLSGGQRQRVALARALVREPELLLLDDPLASVDAGREDEILGALAESWQGKTVLLVSQRLSAFRDCQRILVLDEGRIVEQGTPEELLQLGGRYAELARMQGGLVRVKSEE
ncbi:MAG: ABC transporter ATP-binding protein/permease [Geobacteraceae bacterium]|nr:ABC transporter ATP-binding protein/permease [Geobacteraceae bacterium]